MTAVSRQLSTTYRISNVLDSKDTTLSARALRSPDKRGRYRISNQRSPIPSYRLLITHAIESPNKQRISVSESALSYLKFDSIAKKSVLHRNRTISSRINYPRS
ncbi:hypothetical protein AVEN_180356-1 [Araneus ventricosus]|uniref:Uncharacterized protein n=1 Tax=Araneus ventricosus TaxID=182803 RepID=A0A4Y2EML7_ARAVE|nr:hypothetical protein AVEN_180356-1 [Araneus ventricosus]